MSIHAHNFKDLKGKKFGRLFVIEDSMERYFKEVVWKCRCDCGNQKMIIGSRLSSGVTKSCGCLANELTRKRLFKHGKSANSDPTYQSWSNMLRRCYNKKNIAYERYGGRGIKVCSNWKNNFVLFLDDMGERPEGLTLERIDNDGNYTPENCKWATRKEQGNNKTNNILITDNSVTKTQSGWASAIGISPAHFKYHYDKGRNIEKIQSIIKMNKLPRTHCPHGHRYDEENTYINTKGSKVCRKCHMSKKSFKHFLCIVDKGGMK